MLFSGLSLHLQRTVDIYIYKGYLISENLDVHEPSYLWTVWHVGTGTFRQAGVTQFLLKVSNTLSVLKKKKAMSNRLR